jgi:hypothetical protein
MSINTIINAATLAITAWSIADSLGHKPEDPDKQVSVSLFTGIAPNAGGSVPHLAVWDGGGSRIGQYKGDANGHIDENGSKSFTISPTQNGGHQATPEYLLVVMQETDAICLSGLAVSGNGDQWTWTGDMGYTCGAQWYPSKRTIGTSNIPIKCVWLDSDHSNGIIAKGLSLHMPSFAGDQGLVDQYKEDQRRLCQNSARMTFQPEPVVPDSIPRFFKHAPEYDDTGALKKPNEGIDRGTRAYPDGTNFHIHDTKKRRHARDVNPQGLNVTGVKNVMPGHVVISNLEGHSAKEVCEHPNSLGPDFVNKNEGIFCDMETGKWWPLCDEKTGTDEACFDLDTKTMKNYKPGSVQTRNEGHPVPQKEYNSHEEW